MPFLHDLARLRIEVFRDYPYLYDGDMHYEQTYLKNYAQSPESLFVLAYENETIIGVSTGVPLRDETETIQRPFQQSGINPDAIFYLGESVLSKAYRGRGIGSAFMRARETFALERGRFTHTAFCAVERPRNHPRRPHDFIPLDKFWEKYGYKKNPQLHTQFSWKELDELEESPKKMVFWLKCLKPE